MVAVNMVKQKTLVIVRIICKLVMIYNTHVIVSLLPLQSIIVVSPPGPPPHPPGGGVRGEHFKVTKHQVLKTISGRQLS